MDINDNDFTENISNLLCVPALTVPGYEETICWNIGGVTPLQLIIGIIERSISIRSGATFDSDVFPLTVYIEGLISASFVGKGVQFFFEDKQIKIDLSEYGVQGWRITMAKLLS